VVESAAGADKRDGELWGQMIHNRRFGARWAASTIMSKPGLRSGLTEPQAESVLTIAIDWATYRTLHDEIGLTDQELAGWVRDFYQRMLIA
jgi:hypothetical protein